MIVTTPVHADGTPLTFKDFYQMLCERWGRNVHQSNKVAHVFTQDDVPALEQYIRDNVEATQSINGYEGVLKSRQDTLALLEENQVAARMLIQRIHEYNNIQVFWKSE